MTLFKRSAKLQQQLRGQLDGLAAPAEGLAALEQLVALDGIAAELQRLGADSSKMKAKAQETDPDKKVCCVRCGWLLTSCRLQQSDSMLPKQQLDQTYNI